MRNRTRKNRVYSPKFKIGLIEDLRNNNLGIFEAIHKYFDESVKPQNIVNTIKNWERIYLEEGAEGLMKERRGKTSIDSPKRGRPPKLDKQVEEDLIAENQRLRMEIEYLKKLSALVLADEQKNSKKR